MTQTVYVVQRINWEWSDEWYYSANDTPVKAFRSRSDAEQYQQLQENKVRKELVAIPPEAWSGFRRVSGNRWNRDLDQTFGLGRLYLLTSLPRDVLRQRVQSLGLPDFHRTRRWDGVEYDDAIDSSWWEHAWKTLRPEQWDNFWALFDRITFYEVVEVELYS